MRSPPRWALFSTPLRDSAASRENILEFQFAFVFCLKGKNNTAQRNALGSEW
jgi:hypothetical protein